MSEKRGGKGEISWWLAFLSLWSPLPRSFLSLSLLGDWNRSGDFTPREPKRRFKSFFPSSICPGLARHKQYTEQFYLDGVPVWRLKKIKNKLKNKQPGGLKGEGEGKEKISFCCYRGFFFSKKKKK